MLLKHVATARLIVASRVMGSMSSGTAFQCQRSTALNKESWEPIGIDTTSKKSFEEPEGGYRVGALVHNKYEVIAFSDNGWMTTWGALVTAAAAARAGGGGGAGTSSSR